MKSVILRIFAISLLVCGVASCQSVVPQAALDACPNWPNARNEVMPIWRVDPRYPTRAHREGLEGHVDIESVVGRDGRVQSARVAGSQPPGVFDDAALHAFEQWRYCPLDEGVSDYPNPVKLRLQFRLD